MLSHTEIQMVCNGAHRDIGLQQHCSIVLSEAYYWAVGGYSLDRVETAGASIQYCTVTLLPSPSWLQWLLWLVTHCTFTRQYEGWDTLRGQCCYKLLCLHEDLALRRMVHWDFPHEIRQNSVVLQIQVFEFYNFLCILSPIFDWIWPLSARPCVHHIRGY